MFYAIAPFKGKNGEEVCHKCAPCVKCGKETCGNYYSAPHEKTDDNPSGVWALAYCSIECFKGTEKSSLPKSQFKKCSKCNISHDQNLGPVISNEVEKQCRIFNKNGEHFCFNCLASEYNINC